MSTEFGEKGRLAALKSTGLLDTAPEPVFDRLTSIASRALKTPMAMISLLDDRRQFFKSQQGLPSPFAESRETPISHSICQYVVARKAPLIVDDARTHHLLSTNAVVKDFKVVAYAGVPLIDAEGNCLGSICVLDLKPRAWNTNDVDLLKLLAAQTMAEISQRGGPSRLNPAHSDSTSKEEARYKSPRPTVHDLREPLNSLIHSLDVLDAFKLTAEQKGWVTLARSSSSALTTIVDGLVDTAASTIGRADVLSLSRGDAREIAELAFDRTKESARAKTISLKLKVGDSLPAVSVDVSKITRVLVNLLSNAVKFTPAGGTVGLRVFMRAADLLAFEVSDTGVGFNQDQSAAIFEPEISLSKGSRSGISTGWGLDFCQFVVEAHRGLIEVKSELGKGSTFTVVLPVNSEPAH